jgi:hypothetical protein
MVMTYTIETQSIDERTTKLTVTFENGFTAETTVIGGEEQAQWYAEQAFVPDLLRIYPELRGEA